MLGIIAAGGLGTRMGSEIPKPLTLLPTGKTFLSTAIEKLIPYVDEIVIVTSMKVLNHKDFIRDQRCNYRIQLHPTGMGDAVFSASDLIAVHDDVLILWCDQIGITEQTISDTIAAHKSLQKVFKCTVPLVTKNVMYTHFEVNNGRLENVFQAREGDEAPEPSNSDVGLFVCTGGQEFITAWIEGGRTFSKGRITLEYNFIPFLKYLGNIGWNFQTVEAREMDGIGVNNPNELQNANKRLIQ